MNKKAVCLISGGLDSCVTAHIAKSKGFDIYGLTFNYGQKHKKEVQNAKTIALGLNAKNHIFLNLDLDKFKGSSLTDNSLTPEKNHFVDEIGKKIPSTYVPARNIIFLSIALAYAESIDADFIFIGVTSSDYSGYPDCRPKFIESFQKMADIGTKKGIEGKKIEIDAPLINMKKSEIILLGSNLKVPFEKTWSCYFGKEKACGRCDSCLLRLKGFKEAKIKDPLLYESIPEWYN
jgi:7-cyano-7-deazaguanine synthase